MTDSKQIAHSPTPWSVDQRDRIRDKDSHYIGAIDSAYKPTSNEANSTHIVRCVNSHDALIQTLETVRFNINLNYHLLLEDAAHSGNDEHRRNHFLMRAVDKNCLMLFIDEALRLAEGGE